MPGAAAIAVTAAPVFNNSRLVGSIIGCSFRYLDCARLYNSIRRTAETRVCAAETDLDVVTEREADEVCIIDPRTAAQHSKPSPVPVCSQKFGPRSLRIRCGRAVIRPHQIPR